MRTGAPRFFSVVLPLLLLCLWACTPQRPPAPRPTPSAVETAFSEPTPFAGSAACQRCHTAEFESHSKTFHATTLRAATLADLAGDTPAPGPVVGGGRFEIEDGQLIAYNGTAKLPLQLALGSGKTGITFLAVFEKTSAEIRQSYFPQQKRWQLTPGIEARSVGIGSAIHPEEQTRQCLGCHAVTLPIASLQPERRFFGVGCESCHGPGAEHIAAMERGERPQGLAITSLRGASGTQLNALCGRCHRTKADVEAMSASARSKTNRFQPYGLALSKCFQKSGDTLTCVTCHNPHENAGKDPKPYETACLSCHAGGGKQVACPINPKAKCVGCHMPNRPVLQHSTIPITMADHFIRRKP